MKKYNQPTTEIMLFCSSMSVLTESPAGPDLQIKGETSPSEGIVGGNV